MASHTKYKPYEQYEVNVKCEEIQRVLEIDVSSADNLCRTLPFGCDDTTVGTENEYQTSVLGSGETVDLPRAIRESSYYKNLIRRTASGDVSQSSLDTINNFIDKTLKRLLIFNFM